MSRRPPTAATGRVPARLVAPSVVALVVLVLPLVGLLVRAPWSSIGQQVTDTQVVDALRLSLVTATISACVALVLGVPLAWLLARVDFPGRSFVRAVVTVPLVLPPVVGGVALLMAFGRTGVLGAELNSCCGITLPFTTPAVVVAQTFVAMPFCVISVEGALRGSDRRMDDAAATLGASRWRTFSRVTVPLALPGIVSGGVLSWARALGEFGATITFAGNIPGITQTMPSAIYLALQNDPEAAITLSLLLLGVSVLVLAMLRERWLAGASA